MSRESRLIKNTAIIAVGNICTKCISFFMLPLYTSILTTEEYGSVDLVSTYATLLIIILTLQMEQGVFRYLVESRGNVQKQKSYISTSFLSVLVVCLMFVLVVLPLLSFLEYKYTVYLVGWAIIGTLNAFVLQLPRGLGNNAVYATGSFISGSSNVALNVVFVAFMRLGVNGMLLANILALMFSVLYIAIRMKLWNYIGYRELDSACFKELVSYSFPLIPYTLCWWIINASDRQIINTLMNTSANGIYSIAYKFPSMFSLVTGIFQTAWTESAAENVNDSDSSEYYEKMVNRTFKFYSSGTIGIISAIPFVFDILVKNDFKEAYYYIPILMISALFHSITSIYGSIYFAFKETKKVAWTTALAALINILLNVVFIKSIGLYATAISTLLAYVVVFIIRQRDIQKMVKIHIPINFAIQEITAYVIVLAAYYSKNTACEIVAFVMLVPYCIYQNREVVLGMLKKVSALINKR